MKLKRRIQEYLDSCNFPDEHILRVYIAQLEADNAALQKEVERLDKAFDWSAQKNKALQKQVEGVRGKLKLFRSSMGDGGDLEYAANLLRTATNDHGIDQTYENNPYAVSEQLEAMGTFLGSEPALEASTREAG